jgi:hypothetical protein
MDPGRSTGLENDASVMSQTSADLKNLDKDLDAYALAFAKAFGPSSEKKLVASVEIDNELGNYPDDKYRTLFENRGEAQTC